MNRNTTTSLAFVCGALFGATVGAALGVFLAPAKGERTRRLLARKAEDFGHRATEMAADAREAIEHGARRFG